ncbi:universal stress protein [Alicyclobacillus sp. SO9]|uniref:universal stress protein n=1 Tax=Alicyclobacillus sp. SO9 TaxID=2665646 RepID=UPI0018E82AE5|nr:universal stress protein [Alicyclobacillus sp. SO9]QQE80496.1 universal stress protein [Alicyclobacillus sp. SO9]
MKVLLAHDGTHASVEALKWVGDFAEQNLDAEIVIVHVTSDNDLPYGMLVPDDQLTKVSSLAREVEESAKDFSMEHWHNKVRFEHYIGSPVNVILETAKLEDVDLVVMGSGPQRRFLWWLSSNVSHRVSKKIEVPVVIVKINKEIPITSLKRVTAP